MALAATDEDDFTQDPQPQAQEIVTNKDAGMRLQKYIRKAFPVLCPSKVQAHTTIKEGKVLVNGVVSPDTKVLAEGDVVLVTRTTEDYLKARNFVALEIGYEDLHLAIVYKPSGIGTSGHPTKTLELALPYNLRPAQSADALSRPECINDLDKATAGFVLVAKTLSMKDSLIGIMGRNEVEMRHHLMCHGNLEETFGKGVGETFEINDEIQGQTAVATACTILSVTRTRHTTSGFVSSAVCSNIRGNIKHQARIHLMSRNHPVIGNTKHTLQHRSVRDKGTFMALTYMGLVHPITGVRIEVEKPEPEKFEAFRVKDAKAWAKRREDDVAELVGGAEGSGDVGMADVPEGVPVAYVTGIKEFCNLRFHVSPAVMVPRPASQTLVRVALDHLSKLESTPCPSVLDLGTGSGCILVSILHSSPTAIGLGLDASADAIDVAKGNATELGVIDRSSFVVGTFAKLADALQMDRLSRNPTSTTPSPHGAAFDVIVCNPPYLTKKRTEFFESRSLAGEPESALFAGETGYEAYQDIESGIAGAIMAADGEGGVVSPVRDGTLLVLEVAPGMGRDVKNVFERRRGRGAGHKRRRVGNEGARVDVGEQDGEQEEGKEREGEAVAAGDVVGVDKAVVAGGESNDGAGRGRWRYVETVLDDKGMERCVVFRRICRS